jgi:hypothetical protein
MSSVWIKIVYRVAKFVHTRRQFKPHLFFVPALQQIQPQFCRVYGQTLMQILLQQIQHQFWQAFWLNTPESILITI